MPKCHIVTQLQTFRLGIICGVGKIGLCIVKCLLIIAL